MGYLYCMDMFEGWEKIGGKRIGGSSGRENLDGKEQVLTTLGINPSLVGARDTL